MRTLVTAIREWATELGGAGLFIVALLDSSFLSFPQVNDLLIIYLSTKTPALMPWYAGMSTAGSVLGCTALFFVGRRGGEVFLRARFKAALVDQGLRLYARFGVLSVLVLTLLPPPTPFKMFVLLAGASGLATWRFVTAVTIGRVIRYFGQGYLAVLYGEQAVELVRAHSTQAGLLLAGLVILAGVVVYFWRRRAA
jgi:membrane protein YqaA with SNARE-associated domain